MTKILLVRTKDNGAQLQMKLVHKRLVWFYIKRGWQVNKGQLL